MAFHNMEVFPYLPLFLLLLLHCHRPTLAAHKNAHYPITETELREKKALCFENIDNGLWGWHCRSSAIARENCALRCISAACYDHIYGHDSLEEGEVDFKRGREFKYCMRRESVGESLTGKTYLDE